MDSFVKIPLFTLGPVKINGNIYKIPLASTDGFVIDNLNRITEVLLCEGVVSGRMHESMTALSVVKFKNSKETGQALIWLNNPQNFNWLKNAYENSCPLTSLCRFHGNTAGPFLSIRFTLQHKKDDSMEIRNVTKGMQAVLGLMKQIFDDMKIVSCTGDLRCSQDKSSVPDILGTSTCTQCSLMTVQGMGECVVTQTVVSAQLIRKILKCSLQDLIMAYKLKNLIDSSAGGLTPLAANIVSSAYMALGKCPIQMILKSSCVTTIKPCLMDGDDALHIRCTFPSFCPGLKINNSDFRPPTKYKTIVDNFNDIVPSLILMSELDELRELAVNFKRHFET